MHAGADGSVWLDPASNVSHVALKDGAFGVEIGTRRNLCRVSNVCIKNTVIGTFAGSMYTYSQARLFSLIIARCHVCEEASQLPRWMALGLVPELPVTMNDGNYIISHE